MPEQILQTAGETFRRRLHYERAAIGLMGSWNPDASFGNLRDNDFTEVLNLRMPTNGGYEARTGYLKYVNNDGPFASLEILCKSEYRYKVDNIDVLFDITIYQVGNKIYASGVNRNSLGVFGDLWWTQYSNLRIPIPDAPTPNVITIAPTSIPAAPPQIAEASQFGVFLVITVFGVGTFAIYPSPSDLTASTWLLRDLGKNLANTPYTIRFVDTTTGDMFLTSYTDVVTGHVHAITPTPATDLTSAKSRLIPPYLYTRQPMGMKYFLSSGTAFAHSPNKLFQWNEADDTTKDVATTPRSSTHLQTRAWGYRFVFVRSFTDSRGNKIKFRSQASVDLWVPNMIYCPPQPYLTSTQPVLSTVSVWNAAAGPDPGFTGGGPRFIFGNSPGPDITILPSQQDMVDAERLFLQFIGQTWTVGATVDNKATGIDETTWLVAMWQLGFRRTFDGYEFIQWEGTFQDAWFKAIPASVLKSAPMTSFKWTDFSTTDGSTVNPDFPTDTIEIEVYRTAWSDGDLKQTDNDPAFQPHLYGYVGSIKPDNDFTDDVMDEVIDFGKQPSDYDGFLTGQFSGQVIREISGKLAIGNCSTSYEVFAPWSHYQLTAYNRNASATTPYTVPALTTLAPDGLPQSLFSIQYVDDEGNISDLISLTDPTWTSTAVTDGITDLQIVIPQGYDPNITGINVWFSYYSGGSRIYKLVKTVSPDAGYITIFTLDITAITPSQPSLLHNTKTIVEGGEVIWSDVNDMFAWNPINDRIVRKTGNITALEVVVGELMIFSDTAIDYDNLNSVDPRGEEVSKWLGCIGRFAFCKVDKVVFILTANGLFFAEPGGVVPFPANVQSVVLDYIRETIPNIPDMANARRATIGYDAKRYELWLYFPSSADLGGSLPEKLIVYKFFNPDISHSSVQNFVNYRFDLLAGSDVDSASPEGTQNMPIFQTASDGKLFCSYRESTVGGFNLVTIDCDADTYWLGPTALEHVYGLGAMNIIKYMRNLMVAGDFDCNLSVRHSSPSQISTPNSTDGYINNTVPSHSLNLLFAQYNAIKPHRIGGTSTTTASAVETTSYTPVVRLESTQRDGRHILVYKAIDLEYQVIHNHPA